MKSIAYYNGQIGAQEDLKVSFQDRALYFGDGCYDAAFVINSKVVDFDDHIARFFNSMRMMRIEPAWTPDEVRAILMDLVNRLDVPYGFLYWQTSRGNAPRNHPFPKDAKANLLCFYNEKPGMPDVMKQVSMITVEDVRYYYCNIKTLNLFPNVMANQKAMEAGAGEAIQIRPDGFVTEGSHTNVHILKDGVLYTHEDGNLILPGITKKHMLIAAREAGIPVVEKAFTREELLAADEIFVSGSSTFVERCCELDGVKREMRDEANYRKIAEGYLKHTLDVTR